MPGTDQMATALLTEHFRYTPLTLLDDIINTVNELVFRAINAIEEGLNSASAHSLGFSSATAEAGHVDADELEAAKTTEIAHGVVQLESLLNATVDRDFDKFEIYTLRNILAVGREEEALAPWVRLGHYKAVVAEEEESGAGGGGGNESAADARPTPEQVQLMRRKLQETRKLNVMLREEEARNEALLVQLRGLTGTSRGEGVASASSAPLAFLTSEAGAAGGSGQTRPLQTRDDVQYALSLMPALKQLLADLRAGRQETLPWARRRAAQGEDETEDEAKRRRYVDGRARRAVERKGLDTGAEETGRIGSAGADRRVGREEVEGVEAVVVALESERRSGGQYDETMDED